MDAWYGQDTCAPFSFFWGRSFFEELYTSPTKTIWGETKSASNLQTRWTKQFHALIIGIKRKLYGVQEKEKKKPDDFGFRSLVLYKTCFRQKAVYLDASIAS